MNAVMTLNALAMRQTSSSPVQVDDEIRNFWLERENACLTQSNARLRLQLKDLEASARRWIRLYEASLDRANAATAECARLRQQLEQG
jgi:CRISPR/Cas system type I-B associated protein Csh2 (Cas7 group RAMP superfamily)